MTDLKIIESYFFLNQACVPEDVKEPEPIGKNTEDVTTTPAPAE
jgi:hypothetical protein